MPDLFGHMPSGEPVHRIALDNGALRVQVLTIGAALQTIEAPDRDGARANVALGLATLEDYATRSPHFGAVAGRYAGRIAHGRFTLDGVAHQLTQNRAGHSIHGGAMGFGKRAWMLTDHGPTHANLAIGSLDGDEGYPGAVQVRVRYSLDGPALRVDYEAETDAPTILNLTNHSYFNLQGEGAGDVLGHRLTIDSDRFLPMDADSIPTGEIRAVEGTVFDFRTPCPIGARIRTADPQILQALGYDHTYMLPGDGLRRAALLEDPVSGRTMTVLTTEPCVHLYTGNNLTGSLAGPSGRAYRQTDGVCLETERPQNSPNRPEFPSTVLRPGTVFRSSTVFRFGVSDR